VTPTATATPSPTPRFLGLRPVDVPTTHREGLFALALVLAAAGALIARRSSH
jgi:hypothetical protein